MRLNLGTQLYILIFLVVVIALSINSYFDYRNMKENYLVQAYIDSKVDMDIIKSHIKNESNNLNILLKKIAEDKNIQNSLNLISNYQDKKNYNEILFDTEKKNLLKELDSKINTLGSYSFAMFDKEKDLVVVNRIVNDFKKAKGFITYSNSLRFFQNIKENKKTKMPYIYDINKDKISTISIKLESNAFSIRLLLPIYLEKKLVGYIRAKRRFSSNNIDFLLQNINNKFSFLVNDTFLGTLKISNKEFILNNTDSFEKENHSYTEMFNDENYFYHSHYINTLNNKKLYFISGTNKKILDNKVLSLLKEFNLSVLLSIFISFILAFIFVRISILNPLNRLVSGMQDLKKGRYNPIVIKSNNEFKSIALEFNQLNKQLENSFLKIEQMNKFLENILDTVPVRIFWKDKNGVYLGANKLFIKDAGLKNKSDLIGKDDYHLPWANTDAEKYRNDDLDVIINDKEKLLLEETQTNDNGHITLLTSKVPLKNKEGEIIGVLGVYEDISKQKNIEKQLKDKDLILFEQSKLASMGEMLENIAHQWRQPLSMITTSSTGVLLGKEMDMLTDKILLESLENITNSAKHLSQTIDDFRDFFKTDNEIEKFDIKYTFEKSKNLLSSKFKNKEIDIVCNLESIYIEGYESELIQVFINILNNAKDALDEIVGTKVVLINAEIKDDIVYIYIRDNAGGIQEDILEKIFEHKFTTKLENNGTGIGLYMSKLIIEKIKGKLYSNNVEFDYKDEHFVGALFTIEVPLN